MQKQKVAPRTRMSPQDRKESILSHAASLVLEEGVTEVTIDKVRLRAGVSRSLIYNYFKDTNELLIALFDQECRKYRELQSASGAKAQNFDEMIRFTIRTRLEYYLEHGELILRLTNEPAIANAVLNSEEEIRWQKGRDAYYTKQFVERYQMPEEVAKTTIQLLIGMAEAAGLKIVGRLGEEGLDFLEEMIYTSTMASLKAIGQKYGNYQAQVPVDDEWLEQTRNIIGELSNMFNNIAKP